MRLKVGTRGSKLSLIQTDQIIEKLKRHNPGIEVERIIIHTSGDLDRETPLFSLNQKGIFEREVDEAVVQGNVDFAVHSMKDLPTLLSPMLTIAAVPEREAVADVLVSREGKPLGQIPDGSLIGTSSLLRSAQLKRVRPGLRIGPIRGNVDTRVEKVDRGDYDAVILAEAGLNRLGITDRVVERLSIDDFMPAPGQGALAVVARRDDSKVIDILKTAEYSLTRHEVQAERELVSVLEGGCKVPIGATASAKADKISLTASILSLDGKERLIGTKVGSLDNATDIGRSVGIDLLERGAKRIEESWRTVYA